MSEFETDAFPFGGAAKAATTFEHEVGVIVGFAEMGEDDGAQILVVHGFQKIACLLV